MRGHNQRGGRGLCIVWNGVFQYGKIIVYSIEMVGWCKNKKLNDLVEILVGENTVSAGWLFSQAD